MTAASGDYEIFCKLAAVELILQAIDQCRRQIRQELYAKATDPVLLKRRFRMLSQIADYERQIYRKIYNFSGDCLDDYLEAAGLSIQELRCVVNRDA